ncbi:hypothetical protein [Citreimonas salinaria]|uniref:Uncharacterized protein n=1 Tax=Citreimonas salinaria TaxID=321339 RepID=A0A1H3KRF8_9RHOB|nr:hypothetical protein [Citreimonas salinaria]SDY54701.1 hypothetical protein SAMN05444340_11062 [Citreimonas salinaria]
MIRLTRKAKLRPELQRELTLLRASIASLRRSVGRTPQLRPVEIPKEGSRPMPHGWWIVPGTLVSLLLWVALFKLVGVL